MGAVYTGKGTTPVQWLLIYYIYLDIAIDKNPAKKQKTCVTHFRLMFQCFIKAMLEKSSVDSKYSHLWWHQVYSRSKIHQK